MRKAEAAIERLAGVEVEVGFALFEVQLLRLRALLAGAQRDEASYRNYRDCHRGIANRLASRGTWNGVRPCHDGDRSGGMPTMSQNRRDMRVSKLRVGVTHCEANSPSWSVQRPIL